MNICDAFITALEYLPRGIKYALSSLPKETMSAAYEIRLRAGSPVMLSLPKEPAFVSRGGRLCRLAERDMLLAAPEDIKEVFANVCMHSVYSHQSEIAQGYVITPKGHRVGICGTAVISDGRVTNIRDISSVNIRIPREIKTAAAQVVPVFASCDGGIIISGAPASGKTTVLRDLARRLSKGEALKSFKVAVIDERGEIASVYRSVPQYDLGPNCDVISGIKKQEGMLLALRSMSPEVVIFDEIGTKEEIQAVIQSLNSGVRVVTSIHAGSLRQLMLRPQMSDLIRSGAFSRIVQLGGRGTDSHIEEVKDMEDFYAEADRRGGHNYIYNRCGSAAVEGA